MHMKSACIQGKRDFSEFFLFTQRKFFFKRWCTDKDRYLSKMQLFLAPLDLIIGGFTSYVNFMMDGGLSAETLIEVSVRIKKFLFTNFVYFFLQLNTRHSLLTTESLK